MPTNSKKNDAATDTPTIADARPERMIVAERNLHPEAEAFLSELVDAAKSAQTYARGSSEVLYRVSQGEEAYPDPQATAEAVIALAGQVNTLTSVVLELARLVKHGDIKSDSKGLPH